MKPGYYLAGTGATGFDAGAAEFEVGALGIEEAGTGPPLEGAVSGTVIGTGTLRPSKILPLMRLVEEYARNSEVNANSAAKVQVSLNGGVLAPPAPNTV